MVLCFDTSLLSLSSPLLDHDSLFFLFSQACIRINSPRFDREELGLEPKSMTHEVKVI